MAEFTAWDCPECGTKYKLPDGKKPPRRCKKCADWGQFEADVISAEPAVIEPRPTFVEASPKLANVWKPRRRVPWWAWLAALLTGAAIAVCAMLLWPTPRHDLLKDMTREEQQELRDDLFQFAKAATKKNLKSPSSAKFADEYTIDIRPDLANPERIEAVIKGQVESQNGFGVFLNNTLTVRIAGNTRERAWKTRAVFIGDDVQEMDDDLVREILNRK